ncbi:MAG: PAS domain S-box protein [Theionarchaea archaeon]|nr:MAG: hypothetical protein AYK19_15625 [Theionarchaea archaeon DG-70-1]MBU7028841.1 PAS domain S-box protein [Theionarchaea archaeon]
MAKASSLSDFNTLVERMLQSDSFTTSVERFVKDVTQVSTATSVGFFVLYPEIHLVSFRGEKPHGKLAEEIRKAPENRVIQGAEAAFSFSSDETPFGVLELLWDINPPREELDIVETLCSQAALTLETVKKYEELKLALEREVNQRKTLEGTLQEGEEKYKNVIERANDGIAIIQDAVIKYINPRLTEISGYTADEVVGTPFTGYVHPDELARIADLYKRRITGEDVRPKYETVIKRRDGSPLHVEVNAGVTTYAGAPADLVIVRDITERKKMEEALSKSEEKYKNLLEFAPDAIITLDLKGVITSCNTATFAISGYSKEEIVGNHISKLNLLQMRDIPTYVKLFISIVRGKVPEVPEINWIHKDGTLHMAEVRARLIKEGNKSVGVLVITRDITERKKAEEMLKLSEEKYRTLIENLNVGVYRVTPGEEGQFIDVNQAFVNMLDYDKKEDILKLKVADIYVNPKDRKKSNDKISAKGSVKDMELHLKKKDGTPIIISDTATAVYDTDGTLLYFDGVLEDITERKRAEGQIRESLREKEVLLQELHHRVKNNMQIISSLLNLQAGYIGDDHLLEVFKESQNRIKSMALVHERLYESKDMARIDFKAYVQSLTNSLFQSYSAGDITLKTDVKDISLTIDNAIPCGLIINELVSNSLKHAFPDKKGEITIALHPLEGNKVELIVSDNGCGMPDIDFRSTKSLGLCLVAILAEDQLKGKITLDRTRGIAFHITFQAK